MREKLPEVRDGHVRRFHLVYFEDSEETGQRIKKELKIYIRTGLYPDGRLGEVFIDGEKQGGMIRGAMDALAMLISVSLQHGVPLKQITSLLRHNKFGPAGMTGDAEFRTCTSIFDLIAQYLDATFPDGIHRSVVAAAPTP